MVKIKAFIDKVNQKLHLTPKKIGLLGGITAVVVVLIVALIIFLGLDRVPKESLVIINANKMSSIKNAGFDPEMFGSNTLFKAKWVVDEKPDFEIQNAAADITEYDTLHFKMKLDSAEEARIMFYFGSENDETETADYYSYTMLVQPGEWKEYSYDLSKLVAYGEPLGLDHITEISIRTTGWRNKAAKESVIHFGNMYISGDKLKLSSTNISSRGLDDIVHFTQDAIDEAAELAAKPTGWPQYDNGAGLDSHGNSYPAEKCTNALYYLTLAVRYNELDETADPLYASNGMLCKDAVIQLLEFFLEGGNEPMASVGPYWGHAVMAQSLLLIRNTDCIYDELSQDTKDRMDWMMRAFGVAANWGYNDANDYATGFDLHGNFGKGWNMNYQNSYLSVMLACSLYFGSAELDDMFVNFDYDTYLDKFREYKFINVIYAWETAGKTLMETGVTDAGEDPVLEGSYGGSTDGSVAGDAAGSGKGVKIPFKYTLSTTGETISLQDEDFAIKLFTYQTTRTYSQVVASSNGAYGDKDYCLILGDVIGYEVNEENGEKTPVYNVRTSPFEGRIGMFSELNATDSMGKRSCLVYPYDSFEILTTVYANMKLFGGWDSSTEEMQAIDEQIYVGNEDFLFRAEYGHKGYASGHATTEHEWTFEYRGILFIKDIWKNFHCDWGENTTIKQDPDTPEIIDLPDANPMGGVTEAPNGALAAQTLYNNTFVDASYTSIGTLSSGTIEFDFVVGNDTVLESNDEYDAVIAIMQKGNNKKWSNMNMSIQLQNQLVNIRSGSSYARTGFQFESNYRFHAEITFDAVKKTYSAKIYQIYPTVGEAYECADIPFRTGSDLGNYVDAIAVMKQNATSDLWLENVYVNGKLIPGTDVKYSTTLAVAVEDTEAPDTKLRVHTKIWKEFTDYTKTNELYYVNRETVVMTAKDISSDLSSLQYCVTTKPLSESAVKSYGSWETSDTGVACFKIEPYEEYYVYVKASDSSGNVCYVSNHIMLDPDIPVLTGVVNGKTYCEQRTITVSDRYLSSVTINGEEMIDKLDHGTYLLEKNSGKTYIIVADKAGNTRKATVRLSDTKLRDRIIIDGEDKDTITSVGFTVDSNTVYKEASYSAKWKVDNTYTKLNGVNGDLSDYKTLHFSMMVVPKSGTTASKFMVYFGSKNTPAGKPQYYASYLTIKANTWQTYSIDLADMKRSRNPSWSAIDYLRIQASNWDDVADIMQGSTIYIGYMYLEAGEEDRVHADNPTFEYVPSTTDTAKHDYKYTCCDTVVRTEPHVKSADSDNCKICGQDMNTQVTIKNDTKEWKNLVSGDGSYYTNNARIVISARDYGFGIAKLEYATSASYVSDMNALNWTAVSNGFVQQLASENQAIYFYARVTDGNGKVTYASTEGIVYDKTIPVISGISNGTTYCEPPTITVTDTNLKTVTVGGKTITLDEKNQYTLTENCGTKQIVATDKAGNSRTMTVTVSDVTAADKVISPDTTWKVESTEKSFMLVDESNGENTTGIDISNYKTLTFRMKVNLAKGTTATTLRAQVRLWSHTYYEYVIGVTPNQWQTVTINLYEPDYVAKNMALSKVRLIALVANGGDSDVEKGSTIQIQDMRICEERVHADPIEQAYAYKDSSSHNIRYECCDKVVKTEAHTYGSDGKCIYCTAPEIQGIVDGAAYCVPPTITVIDNNALSYVKINGEAVTLDENNQYTLPNVNGTYDIEAMDQYANKTKASVKVLNIALGETKTISTAFEYDFVTQSRKYKNLTTSDLGEILASYDTLGFDMDITSDTLANGTLIDFWLRLYISNNDYYLYCTKVTVGQKNHVEIKLSQYTGTKNSTSGYTLDMADVATIWFQGDWSNSRLQYCKINVSDMTLTGLHRVRMHTYDQEVQSDAYRVDPNEALTCANGLHYYKSCICGDAGTEIFEGSRSETHSSEEFTYIVNESNAKQHDKVYKCCGLLVATEAHYHEEAGEAGYYKCDACGTEYYDYMDHTAPVISGITDGEVYYNVAPTMTVTDDWLNKVTVNGTEVDIDFDAVPPTAHYRFKVSAEPYVIVATDYSGNQTTYTIKVYAKTTWLSADFENTVDHSTLQGEGWTNNSHTAGAQNSRLNVAAIDGSKVLALTGNNTFSGSPRIMKAIDTTGYDNLTVEFDVKTLSSTPIRVGVNTDMTTRNVSLNPIFWVGGNSESWTTVKLEFKIAGNNATANAYIKSGDEWVADATYSNVGVIMSDNTLYLNFMAPYVTKTSTVYLDNVVMYSISTKEEDTPEDVPVDDGKTEVIKTQVFADDFTNRTSASDLLTAGWTGHSGLGTGGGNAKNSRINIATLNGNKVLELSGNGTFSGSPRVMKAVDVSSYKNLTVEFDVKTQSTTQLQVGINTDMSTRDITLSPVFWKGGDSDDWKTVKIEFTINGSSVSSKTYMKSGDEWVADTTYGNVAYFMADTNIYLNFHAPYVTASTKIWIDNVNIYTLGDSNAQD